MPSSSRIRWQSGMLKRDSYNASQSRQPNLYRERENNSGQNTCSSRGGKHYKSASYVLGECTAIVGFEKGDTDRSSHFEMWAAAVAVNTICVANGKAGAALRLGESIISHVWRKIC